MFSQPGSFSFQLPDWINEYVNCYQPSADIHYRARFVIEASRLNVENKTGGPFAAGIFEINSGKLVSLGVNLVTTQGASILHAEMVAIAIAQKKLGTYDLGTSSLTSHEIITSTEPCAMCLGAIPWSGVRRVITAAHDSDARNIGFNEGIKPENWIHVLEQQAVEVISNIEREKANNVLKLYLSKNGEIYNSK